MVRESLSLLEVMPGLFLLHMLFSAGMYFTSTEVLSEPLINSFGQLKKLWLYNFGVVVNNENYTIYRSGALGRKGIDEVMMQLEDLGLPAPKTIIYMNSHGYKWPLSFAIEEYALQSTYGYTFHHSFGPPEEHTYLDGYDPSKTAQDRKVDAQRKLGAVAKKYFKGSLNAKNLGDTESFKRVLELALNQANQPVLIHCFGGKHRTGMVSMAIRYLQGGEWIKGEKKKFLNWDLNPAQYEYTRYNKLLFRKENIEFIEKISESEYFLDMKERYGPLLK
ncbi:MAG: tyrosine-protein phosphatase [Oligoflexales bacterium]